MSADKQRNLSGSGRLEAMSSLLFLVWIVFIVLTGGVVSPSDGIRHVYAVTTPIILGLALYRLRNGFPSGLAISGIWVLVIACGLLMVQLLPLSQTFWTQLPGRSLIAEIYNIAKLPLPQLPLSLAPNGTKETLLMFVMALAIFCGTMSLNYRSRILLICGLLLCSAIGVFFALFQKAGGVDSAWYMYGRVSGPSGTFGNRNFFAAQLFTAIPLLGAIASSAQAEFGARRFLTNIFVVLAVAFLLTGLALSASRTGLVLAMISLMMTVFFVYRPTQGGVAGRTTAAMLAVLGGVFILGQASLISILRFAESDALADYRWTIYAVTQRAISTYFPYGSGAGSFVPVYQSFEQPSEIIDDYANRAHNDWLEWALEGGLPAIVLMTAFVAIFFLAVFKLARRRGRSADIVLQWASAVVVLLLMAHAMVDFGARTPAILAILVSCCGMLAGIGQTSGPPPARKHRPNGPTARVDQTPASFRPARQSFGRPPAEPTQ
jgi:O-antigen ligase